jgi:chromosome segregation ATPase
METELTRVKEESATERARLQEETEKELTRVKEESASERARLQEALESERSQLQLTTGNLNAVTEAKEKSEAWLQATIDAGNQNLLDMQARLDASRSDLEEKDQRIKALSEESATVGSAREAAEQELVSVIRSLAEANIALEGRQKDLLDLHARLDASRSDLEEKDQRIKALSEESATVSSGRESAEQELASVSRALTEAKTALEAETRNSASQKEDLSRVNAERERAEALAASFSESLKESQNRLEQEQGRYRYNEERLNAIIRERERELGELRQAHEDARTAFSSHASSLDQVRLDLDSAVSARTDLEGKLHAAQEKLLRLDQDLRSGSEEKAQVSRQLSSLADELERLRTKLENETTRRQEAEDQFRDALSQQQQLEQDLERFVSESKTLHADLTAERRMLDAAKEQNQALESQVSALSRGKLEAEQTAADLTAEIEQARVALADEWEDHMTDHERLAVPAGKKQPSETAGSPVEAPEPERTRKRSIIVKAPDILPGFSPLISPVTATDTVNASEPETPHIRSVEDLFEDDEDVEEKQSRDPEVSIIQEPATEPVRDVLPDIISDRSEDQESFFEDEKSSGPDFGTITDEDYTDDEVSILEQSDAVPGSGPAITFNRTQWLNLLKWSHHCDVLSQDQRMQIVRMGRLVQKGRKLTRRQEEQVMEMIALVQRMGYRLP